MKDIIFLQPVFKEMIWGGSRLRTDYGYDIPGDHVGEAWVVSAHKSGDCTIKNGAYASRHLSWLWDNHRELFGNLKGDRFPLLVKIIDAKDDLSIQVHPDDAYAKEHENGSLGKTECWYILDCEPDSTIVVGHNASDQKELRRMIDEKKWLDLIKIRPIKKGDFFQIEPGTVHAIRKGTLILETQQNSDVTYRLYDYDRLQNGKPRELHIQKSIDVIRCPHKDPELSQKITKGNGYICRNLISCEFYQVDKWDINGSVSISQDFPFLIVDVLDGEGTADGIPLKKGDHFILPFQYGPCKVEGTLSLITSHV